MEHYVTLFDSLFLPQGLALHMSMERHVKEYTLWILCVDDAAHAVLTKLQLPNVRLLQLSKLETEELLRVKPTRSIGEYCWTLTPFAPRFVFEADENVKRVTYVDADLWFRKHPCKIFDEMEMARKSVLITDHAYSPEYDQSELSGKYCVQFIVFTRYSGEIVRKLWQEKCIEWCYQRFENGKFGDQKYLEEWPNVFDELVHVLNDKELALGPWNANRYPYSNSVFYHFHSLKIIGRNKVNIGGYPIPNVLRKNIYYPYCQDLCLAIKTLESIGFVPKKQARPGDWPKRFYGRLVAAINLIKPFVASQNMSIK